VWRPRINIESVRLIGPFFAGLVALFITFFGEKVQTLFSPKEIRYQLQVLASPSGTARLVLRNLSETCMGPAIKLPTNATIKEIKIRTTNESAEAIKLFSDHNVIIAEPTRLAATGFIEAEIVYLNLRDENVSIKNPTVTCQNGVFQIVEEGFRWRAWISMLIGICATGLLTVLILRGKFQRQEEPPPPGAP